MTSLHTDSYRALVADDDESCRDLTRRTLQQQGFRCDVAKDGIEAENAIRHFRYHVVIADLRMPRKNGHQLIVEVMSRPDHPLFVVVTGVCEPKIAFDLMARGVADIVLKPCNYELLAAKLLAILQRGSVRGQFEATGKGVPAGTQIELTTQSLKAQLAEVTRSFQDTIEQLSSQKESLEENLLRSVRVLENLMSLGTDREESHASRVEHLALALGDAVGLPRGELQNVRVAALLHDIGLFGMPDSIRHKPPWEFGPEERLTYQRYPIIGAALVSEIPGLENVVTLIETHTEDYDGRGFPASKKGDEIPFGARILRAADGLDTFLLHQGTLNGIDAPLDHVRSQSGKAYDPQLIPFLVRHLTHEQSQDDTGAVTVASVEAVKPGSTLAENLYDHQGHFLARKGATLTPTMLTLIRRLVPGQSVRVHLT